MIYPKGTWKKWDRLTAKSRKVFASDQKETWIIWNWANYQKEGENCGDDITCWEWTRGSDLKSPRTTVLTISQIHLVCRVLSWSSWRSHIANRAGRACNNQSSCLSRWRPPLEAENQPDGVPQRLWGSLENNIASWEAREQGWHMGRMSRKRRPLCVRDHTGL